MPPKGSTKLARTLRDDVRAITGGVPMRWLSLHELGLRHPEAKPEAIEAAVALAIDSGWMIGEGGDPPHSVCLTDAGRRAGNPR